MTIYAVTICVCLHMHDACVCIAYVVLGCLEFVLESVFNFDVHADC